MFELAVSPRSQFTFEKHPDGKPRRVPSAETHEALQRLQLAPESGSGVTVRDAFTPASDDLSLGEMGLQRRSIHEEHIGALLPRLRLGPVRERALRAQSLPEPEAVAEFHRLADHLDHFNLLDRTEAARHPDDYGHPNVVEPMLDLVKYLPADDRLRAHRRMHAHLAHPQSAYRQMVWTRHALNIFRLPKDSQAAELETFLRDVKHLPEYSHERIIADLARTLAEVAPMPGKAFIATKFAHALIDQSRFLSAKMRKEILGYSCTAAEHCDGVSATQILQHACLVLPTLHEHGQPTIVHRIFKTSTRLQPHVRSNIFEAAMATFRNLPARVRPFTAASDAALQLPDAARLEAANDLLDLFLREKASSRESAATSLITLLAATPPGEAVSMFGKLMRDGIRPGSEAHGSAVKHFCSLLTTVDESRINAEIESALTEIARCEPHNARTALSLLRTALPRIDNTHRASIERKVNDVAIAVGPLSEFNRRPAD